MLAVYAQHNSAGYTMPAQPALGTHLVLNVQTLTRHPVALWC